MKNLTLIITFLILTMNFMGQNWEESGNTLTGTEFLGSTNNFDLDLRRNSMLRMRFQNEPLWVGLNSTEANASRISFGLNGETNTAWSMLHLYSGSLGGGMQRNWFNVGLSATANMDFMYVGLLESPFGNVSNTVTDAVISWGCQDGEFGGPQDNFRLLFIRSEDEPNPQYASQSNQGRETLRMTPMGNCGIGDYSNNGFGLNEQPTHRLDVNGQVRIRLMEELSPDVFITGAEEDEEGDYELSYKEFSGNSNQFLNGNGDWVTVTGTGSPDCDWAINPDGDVVTGIAVPGQWGCTQLENVGIGVADPVSYKLEVDGGSEGTSQGAGLFTYSKYDSGKVLQATKEDGGTAFSAKVDGGDSAWNVGLRSAVSTNGDYQYMYGVLAKATNNGLNLTLGNAYGVYGFACDARWNYGVYGDVCDGDDGVYYAGFFNGDVDVVGTLYNTSDLNLKDNVENMNNGLDIIMSLQPKTYNFKTEEYSQMNLPDGVHSGLIAQDVQEIMPNLIQESGFPAKYNDEGEIISEEVEFLSLNYTEFIPILIQATKDQQAIIDEKDAQIIDLQSSLQTVQDDVAALSQMISDCCELIEEKNSNGSSSSSIELKTKNILYQNQPNPFELKTEISYTLVDNGLVEVIIYDAKGIVIETLVNQEQIAGTYSVEWSNPSISRGVYFYALQINGEEHVKRMVKL